MEQILVILLFAVLLLIPILTILRAWIVHRFMGGFLAIGSVIAHLIITIVLWSTGKASLVLTYLVASGLAWLVLPYTGKSGDRRLRKRFREEDIARYERKIRKNPEFGAAYSALADAYMEAERYTDAVAAYQKAIELDPDTTRSERWKHQQAIELIAMRERMRRKKSAESSEINE